jgi:acetolactate synthase-1/2/3 large subunit
MPPDVTVTTDVGSHKIFTALNWEAHAPNRYFVSNGMSVMGFGLASAIAAAYVTREPVVCVTGDAGLAMVQGEMALATEHNLPLTVFLMNDSALDLIRSAQKRRGREVFGTEFTNPDYAHIAAAYDYAYFRVQSRDDCAAAVRAAIESRSPTLIDVWVDPSGYPTTPQE